MIVHKMNDLVYCIINSVVPWLPCVTWFFYVLCDSRYTGPRFILSSATVAFIHPKAEHVAGERRLPVI
jgi:hypothetical protein